MKPLSVLLCALLVVCSVSCSLLQRERPCSATVEDLSCEYLIDPLGIDVREPRLAWRLKAADPLARGTRQTAYRVLVASSEEVLAEDRGDLWDSGDVASDRSVHIVYAGEPLRSGAACWWKVRVKDQAGAISPWSSAARWSMGLLEAGDWKACWMGNAESYVEPPRPPKKPASPPEEDGEAGASPEPPPPPWVRPPDPWFRRSVELDAAPPPATSLQWARARCDSPYGEISSEWRVEGGNLKMDVTVPPNTTAKLYLPTSDASSIMEGGRPVEEAIGARRLGGDVGAAILGLEPGRYSFEAKP